MKVKTAELTGAALDWAVAKCEGKTVNTGHYSKVFIETPGVDGAEYFGWTRFDPSSNWSQGGPIIEQSISRIEDFGEYWEADCAGYSAQGPTPLIAAMRCFAASKFGDEVDVPEELV